MHFSLFNFFVQIVCCEIRGLALRIDKSWSVPWIIHTKMALHQSEISTSVVLCLENIFWEIHKLVFTDTILYIVCVCNHCSNTSLCPWYVQEAFGICHLAKRKARQGFLSVSSGIMQQVPSCFLDAWKWCWQCNFHINYKSFIRLDISHF